MCIGTFSSSLVSAQLWHVMTSRGQGAEEVLGRSFRGDLLNHVFHLAYTRLLFLLLVVLTLVSDYVLFLAAFRF